MSEAAEPFRCNVRSTAVNFLVPSKQSAAATTLTCTRASRPRDRSVIMQVVRRRKLTPITILGTSSALVLAAAIGGSQLGRASAAAPFAEISAAPVCPPNPQTPVGALPPALPVFCEPMRMPAPVSSAVSLANSWEDDFAGTDMTDLGSEYNQFTLQGAAQVFRHKEHWMVDVVPGISGAGISMISPNRTFRANNRKLVIEADYAAAIPGYKADAWGEIDITTAATPTAHRPDGLYAYDEFSGNWTFGCRLQPSRAMTCALEDNTDRGANNGGRKMEISFFQTAGGQVTGGSPLPDETRWRQCSDGQPDLQCRDRFRLEIEERQITLFVNGVQYQQNTDLSGDSAIPSALLNGDVHVYLSSVVQGLGQTARFHWDRFAINPGAQPTTTTTPTTTTINPCNAAKSPFAV
jgi:hypothetical protein